jgi:urease accessory protein
MRQIFTLAAFSVTALAATPALAHTGHSASGFAAGLMHPINGLDHLLVMLGVGLWAAQLGGRNLWLVPLAFVATMLLGAGLSLGGLPLPQVELGIAGSVIAIGLLIGLGARLPGGLAAALVALLAIFHGHAHGSELPTAASATFYAMGIVLSTLALHGIGLVLGLGVRRVAKPALACAAGFATAVLGGAILAGI